MAARGTREDDIAPIPLSVPPDLGGNGGTLGELQRQVSYRSQRDRLERRATRGSANEKDEKDRDVRPELASGARGDEEDVHEDDR